MPRPQPAPIHLELDVFQADDGWRWRIKIWVGNVDVRNTAPTHLEEDGHATGYASELTALRSAQHALAHSIAHVDELLAR